MKSKIKLFLVLALTAAIACMFAACGDNSGNAPVSEPYGYTFNKPFAGTPDEDMKIDGVLDEAAWQNKTYLSQNVRNRPWKVTTHFTKKGVYIGFKVTDPNMSYVTRFTNRSLAEIYICKKGTQTYGVNDLGYHEARCFRFTIDPYYCRSWGRVPYYYKATVNGTLGDGECTMTSELFLTWKDLYFTEADFGENGYPEEIEMYVNYNGESSEVLGTCLWREETYLAFGKDGYLGNVEDENFGSIENGLAATDRWARNAAGNLYTTAGRTQILWLKDAYAKDFMFEAKLKPLFTHPDGSPITMRGDRVYGRFGLINESADAAYNVYSSELSGAPSTLTLQSCRQIDSFHWQNRIGVSEKITDTGLSDDFVTFRVIKQGEMFYYFYGDVYWKSERIQDLGDKAYCGIYTTQGVELIDYEFANYDGKEAELRAKLSEYMYFVDVAGASTYGSVTGSAYAVPKGSPVTVSFLPASRGILTGVTINGADSYDEIVAAMNEKCEYTFTPTDNVSVGATFSAFDSADLVRTIVAFRDGKGELVKDSRYVITGSDKLMYYANIPNASGYVIVYLPKAGEYTVGGRTFTVSGDYNLTSTFSGHHTYRGSFTLNDETTSTDLNGNNESVAEDKKFTKVIVVTENAWGTTKVNGVTLGSGGKLEYNEKTGNYYTESGAAVYYKNYVGKDYEAIVKVDMTEVGNANADLAGIMITNGSRVIIIKRNLENAGSVIVATGIGTTDSSKELALWNFNWTNRQLPSAEAQGRGTFGFRIVIKDNVLYLYDNASVLHATFDRNGMHVASGSGIGWGGENKAAIDKDIQAMFAVECETAIGIRVYEWTNIRAEYAISFASNGGGLTWNDNWGTFTPSRDNTVAGN